TCNIKAKSLKAIIARDASTVKSQNTLTVDDLKITQSDASTVSLDLNAKSVEAVTKDASTLKLSGTASTLDVSSSDASTVKAADLKAGIVTALAHDAARINTWAETKISARATDSGIVTYKGNPAEKNSSATDRGVVQTDDGKMVAESKLETDSTDEDTDEPANEHSFADGYIGFGYVLGPDQKGALIKYGRSREFNFGFGGGYKFFKWNGIGADIYYKSTDFFLQQDSTKTLPNNIQHNAEKIAFNNLGGLVFDRFFIGKMFFDGGIYYDWVFNSRHVTWDSYTKPNIGGGTSTKAIDRNLSFAQPSDYGLQFRIGSQNGFCFYFNYRMADLIKQPGGSATGLPEVPKYVLGINIGGF
ncbi:MAG TPA: DUF2807 domain-containing protein, partial [Bacteroidia bacterium]|nr:DUF2807 domain-containing protein [Bacteroidia bacterium]